ncbi:hypothetical protein [Actinokineospora globicatena]|uniref:hypothetical protein n=1 Tax=Actinokineospora globicatena TaxID=103729 RepID=UPI0020A4DCCB|nr:hypothetical protein [Actinokineospora globicatena]MCP2304063.1 hypothetical protein [Actinokineospora globicatena]GLW78586.1 hypothetical protein Aglo01_30680 [Actinokineospora globicatena]GLW84747.1 hypothetical protein Aglo02_23870 [Actinokineospora globicatena]
MNGIATVGDLVAALVTHDPDTPICVATREHPAAHILAGVACTPDDAEHAAPTDPPIVWLGIGDRLGDLPAHAVDALGWT